MHELSLRDRTLPFALHALAAATVLALLSTAQAAVWLEYGGQDAPWTGLLKARLVDWYCYALFLPLLFALARRFPIGGPRWPEALAVQLGASLVVAAAKEALYVTIGNWFRPGVFDLGAILAEDYGSEVFTVWALIAVAHAVLFQRSRQSEAEARAETPPATDRLIVRAGGTCRFIAVADVDWVDAQGNYARLNTRHGRFLVRETMSELERRLGACFARVHRSAIVRVDRIARIERRPRGTPSIVLEDGARVPTGRTYAEVVRGLLP